MMFSRPYPKWLSWGAQALVILLIYLAVRGWQHRQLVAGPAPSVQVYTLNGQQLSLRDFRDRPVLIHFWATWCPICRLEEETIDTIARDWPVLSIAYLSGSESELRAYMEGRGLDFSVAVDENGTIGDRYGVTAVPVSFIIDSKGRIRFREMGYSTSAGLRLRLWWAEHFDS